MSIRKIKIGIYGNLPSGGAKSTMRSTIKYMKVKFKISEIYEQKYNINNIVQYLYYSLYVSPKIQKYLMSLEQIKLLIVYQSWLVKSPYVLRIGNHKKVYICHEPPREFYEKELIETMSVKERIVNTLRLPIKYIDYYNAKSKNVVFIVNSLFSKNIIDNIYNVNSRVIYPGIDVLKYQEMKYKGNLNHVVSIGAINKLKRQKYILSVIGAIEQSIRPVLVLIANGCDKKYLFEIQEEAREQKVELIIKLNVSEQEKISVLKTSKLFIYSPLGEPFGIAILEAISAGIPIATYKFGGGYAEVINSNNGLIFSELNAEIWSRKITNLLSNKSKIDKIVSFNIQYARKKFGENRMNTELLKVVKSLL